MAMLGQTEINRLDASREAARLVAEYLAKGGKITTKRTKALRYKLSSPYGKKYWEYLKGPLHLKGF